MLPQKVEQFIRIDSDNRQATFSNAAEFDVLLGRRLNNVCRLELEQAEIVTHWKYLPTQTESTTVRLATLSNLVGTLSTNTFTLTATGRLVIDSVEVATSDRILVKNQTDARQNGIYTVTTVGNATTQAVLTRATNWEATDALSAGDGVNIADTTGASQKNTGWALVDAVASVNTNDVIFTSNGPVDIDHSVNGVVCLHLIPIMENSRYITNQPRDLSSLSDNTVRKSFAVIQLDNIKTDQYYTTDGTQVVSPHTVNVNYYRKTDFTYDWRMDSNLHQLQGFRVRLTDKFGNLLYVDNTTTTPTYFDGHWSFVLRAYCDSR